MEAGGGSEGRCGGGVGDEGQEQQAGLELGALGGGRQVTGEGKGGGNGFSLQVKASYRVLQHSRVLQDSIAVSVFVSGQGVVTLVSAAESAVQTGRGRRATLPPPHFRNGRRVRPK